MNRRRFLQGLGIAGLAVAGAGGFTLAQTYEFGITRYRRPLKGLSSPLKVVQLSDLHFGPYIKAGSVRAWVNATNAEQADVVVITGDIVDGQASADGSLETLAAELSRLESRFGTFAIWGNHDNSNPAAKAILEKLLPKNKVEILNNRGLALRPDFYLAGVDDRWEGKPDPLQALKGYTTGTANLMLAHNPDYWDFLRESPVTLALSGHTHGGQIRLPGIGAPWTPSYYGEMYSSGFFKPGQGSEYLNIEGFVSRGLGVSLVPLRLGAPAELVVFEFEPLG
jgi:uncharacterized protein